MSDWRKRLPLIYRAGCEFLLSINAGRDTSKNRDDAQTREPKVDRRTKQSEENNSRLWLGERIKGRGAALRSQRRTVRESGRRSTLQYWILKTTTTGKCALTLCLTLTLHCLKWSHTIRPYALTNIIVKAKTETIHLFSALRTLQSRRGFDSIAVAAWKALRYYYVHASSRCDVHTRHTMTVSFLIRLQTFLHQYSSPCRDFSLFGHCRSLAEMLQTGVCASRWENLCRIFESFMISEVSQIAPLTSLRDIWTLLVLRDAEILWGLM